ncbi:MAG: glycosyl transferase family 2 [Chloroflexi bacterium]|nr:glycosyl transferase family 2 [Chloroflexota bacterium]
MSAASRTCDDSPDVSIIIPAHNEEKRLPTAIDGLTRYLDLLPISAEVVIVENGSTDDTARIGDEAAVQDARFQCLHIGDPGKGRAVRLGMLTARGQAVLFCDADFSMPIPDIDLLRSALDLGQDIVIASREVAGAVREGEPTRRHVMGRVFNWLVRTIAVRGIEDTQCGFKAFRREVAKDLFSRQRTNGWAFDVEILFLARRRGYRIAEVGVTWRYDPSSRVRPVRDTIGMLRELFMIRVNDMRGLYR